MLAKCKGGPYDGKSFESQQVGTVMVLGDVTGPKHRYEMREYPGHGRVYVFVRTEQV